MSSLMDPKLLNIIAISHDREWGGGEEWVNSENIQAEMSVRHL